MAKAAFYLIVNKEFEVKIYFSCNGLGNGGYFTLYC